MLVTTTQGLQDREIVEYRGVVFGEVVAGINFVKDLGAGFRNFFGGRSQGYEEELVAARNSALDEMMRRAKEIGCNRYCIQIDVIKNLVIRWRKKTIGKFVPISKS